VNVRNSTTPKGEKRTDKDPRCQWNSIDWKEVRFYVNRLQTRIAKATHELIVAQSMGCEMLERSAAKVARSVLRRGRVSNRSSLFGDGCECSLV
jgi:hypothetical protein